MESIMNIERIITSINEAIGLSLIDDKSADYKLGYAMSLLRSIKSDLEIELKYQDREENNDPFGVLEALDNATKIR